MGEFMREQVTSLGRSGIVAAMSEDDVGTYGVGVCSDAACRLGGLGSGVHAYAREIAPEMRFHVAAEPGVQ